MVIEYIEAAMDRAHYEMIDDEEPFYGEIPELQGVWATSHTLEDCRRNLQDVVEGWLILSLKQEQPIPEISGHSITQSTELRAVG